jgi:hypothetical protein
MQLDHYNLASGITGLLSNDPGFMTFEATAGGAGGAIRGIVLTAAGTGTGVEGFSSRGIGVKGIGHGSEPSVRGLKSDPSGVAVQGEIVNSNNDWTAVHGVTNGGGVGVVGENTANGPGTWGKAAGTGDGVYGESVDGRGGHFKGKKAQLKLDPSTATTHPSSGLSGDVFLDKSKRLWLCKGGTSWVRIV